VDAEAIQDAFLNAIRWAADVTEALNDPNKLGNTP
jgi:hypothetical protein